MCMGKTGAPQTYSYTGVFLSQSLIYRGTSALNSASTATLVFGVDQKKFQNQPQNRSPGAFSAHKGVTVKRALRARRSFCIGSGATHSCGESRRHLGNQAKTHPHLSTSGGRRGVNVHTMYVRRDAPEGGLRRGRGGHRPNSGEMVPNSGESNSLQLSLGPLGASRRTYVL